MATYDVGDNVRVTASFTTNGAAANPTGGASGMTVTHRKPSGTDTTPTATTTGSTGGWYVDVNLDEVGTHTIRFKGTAGIIAAETIELEAVKSIFDHS